MFSLNCNGKVKSDKEKNHFSLLCHPNVATCIFLFFYNEPELGVGIDPGMALTPLPSSIGQAGIEPMTF